MLDATRILLVLEECGVGDALRASFCLRAVREAYPAKWIVLLVAEETLSVFERCAFVDRIVASRLYAISSRSMLLLRLKKATELIRIVFRVGRSYDLVIILGKGSEFLSLLAWLVGRRHRVGYRQRIPGLLTSKLGRHDPRRNVVTQNLELLRAAGITAGREAPALSWSEDDAAAARRLLEAEGLFGSIRLVVLHPGSDWASQRWLPDRWSQLADSLVARSGVSIVFTGLPRERAAIEAIRGRMQAPSASLAGKTTLHQLAAVLSLARLCICVDSAVFELTQAVGIPAVVLAAATEPDAVGKGVRPPAIVNRTPPDRRAAIVAEQDVKMKAAWRTGQWFSRDEENAGAGLRDIKVDDVLEAVDRVGGLDTSANPGDQ